MELRLYGMIAEKAGADRIALNAASVLALKQAAEERIAGLADLSYAIAVDRRIVSGDAPLNGNEEVALLPPFAGG